MNYFEFGNMSEPVGSSSKLGDDSAQENEPWCKTCFNLDISIAKQIWGVDTANYHDSRVIVGISKTGYRLELDSSSIEASKSSGCGFCAFLDWIATRLVAEQLGFTDVSVVYLSWRNGIEFSRIRVDLSEISYGLNTVNIYRPAKSVSGESTSHYSHIPVRPDITLPNTEESFNCLKEWLNICDKYHHKCTQSPIPPPPKRLLYVGSARSKSARLYKPPRKFPHRYVALSYCWGPDKFLKLCKSTSRSLERGVKIDELPKTMQDAVHITRKLGLKFLWVDALCIMQGDDAEWEEQSGKMCSIFEGAYLTIAASTAPSANTSFLDRDDMRPQTWYYTTETGSTLAARTQCVNGHHYPPKTLKDRVVQDPLNTRGWTLQESLLATRIVFYSREELQWRCKTKKSCECQMTPSDEQPPALIHRNIEPMEILKAWHQIVQMYTQRTLSYQEDKLPAMSGIAQLIHKVTGWTYLAGLWNYEIIRQLLWERDTLAACISPPPPPLTYRAPSFSWAAMDYPVRFGENDYSLIDDARLIDSKMGSGTDPFGRVDNGSLRMEGKLIHNCEVRASTDALGSLPVGLLKSGLPGYTVSCCGVEWPIIADVFLETFDFKDSKGDTRRSVRRSCIYDVEDVPDLESGSMVSLFLLAQSVIWYANGSTHDYEQHCLVLGVSPFDTEKYERLGIVHTGGLFTDVGNAPERITIL
ncbi:HET-domain-containing protein [Hypoxylon sp. NC0597]|nr:HET-domain-containing protein [Hypoxylon sp. NC0597]